jgi:hypothetical protein
VKRSLFNLAAALSLFLCLASVVLWVRSHYRADCLHRRWISTDPQGKLHAGIWTNRIFYSSRGVLSWSHNRSVFCDYVPRGKRGTGWWRGAHPPRPWETSWAQQVGVSFGGFAFAREAVPIADVTWLEMVGVPESINDLTWGASVPLWFTTAISAFAPALWLRDQLKLRRNQQDRVSCPTCGYDLRATPDRCPECGTLAEHA